MINVFRILAKLRGLRGTPFDLFGYSAERKTERRLILEYENTIDNLIDGLCSDNHAIAVEIASLPEKLSGFGHVKSRNLQKTINKKVELLESFYNKAPRNSATV